MEHTRQTNYLFRDNNKFASGHRKFGTEFIGTIINVKKRLLLWEHGQLADEQICFNEYNIPPGWTLAYDLDIKCDGDVYRLTIYENAIRYSFNSYTTVLSSENKTLAHTMTKITLSPHKRGASYKFTEAPTTPSGRF